MDHKNVTICTVVLQRVTEAVYETGGKMKKMQWPSEQGRVQLIILRQDLNWQSKQNRPLIEASMNSEHCDR